MPESQPIQDVARTPDSPLQRWLTVAGIVAVVAGVFFAGFAQAKQGSLATPVISCQEPRVFVHYMPWFRAEKLPNGNIEWEHWQWFGKGAKHDPDTVRENGRRDIAAIHYPLAGPYDGRDSSVLDYHMLTAKAAGVDGFIADWYGPNDYTDKVFAAMVDAAERTGMKVAICLEEKTFFPPYSDAKTKEEIQSAMESQIRHVLKTHAASPAYLRHHGQPVFYIFKNFGPAGALPPKDVAEVLSRFEGDDKILLVRGGYDPAYLEAARGSYVWCPDGSKREPFYQASRGPWQEGKIDYWVGGAYPGFDDSGCWGWGNGPRVVDRRGTLEYEETWKEVLRHKPPIIQISTWNDFQEGTTIEPAEPYGFTFVDLTEKYVGQFTGRPVNLNDNQWAWRIYQLRKKVESIDDPVARTHWSERLDKYSRAFAEGSRFFMGWRLKNLEAGIQEEAAANKQMKQEKRERT
jgi:glycosyl hydrolase family 99